MLLSVIKVTYIKRLKFWVLLFFYYNWCRRQFIQQWIIKYCLFFFRMITNYSDHHWQKPNYLPRCFSFEEAGCGTVSAFMWANVIKFQYIFIWNGIAWHKNGHLSKLPMISVIDNDNDSHQSSNFICQQGHRIF